MLGQICWEDALKGRLRQGRTQVLGLNVWRVSLAQNYRWPRWRLHRAARLLQRQGVGRVLVPPGFQEWDLLEDHGLTPVDHLPMIRAAGGMLMLAALERARLDSGRCAVALRGRRVGAELELAARTLVPRVRQVIVSAPVGGEELARRLHRDYGMAPRPDCGGVEGVLRFDEDTWTAGAVVLSLYGPEPDLGGLELTIDGGQVPADTQVLPLLAALWETGRLDLEGLKIT